jgi:uncharacterized protein (TIRG00374 family)
VVSAALLVWLLHRVDLHGVGETLACARPGFLLLAAVLTPLALAARAVRWRYLFPPRRAPRRLVSATMIGYMVNNVAPLRAGDLVRVCLAGRECPFWTAVSTLAVERVLDATTLLALLGALALLAPVPRYVAWGAAVLLAVDVIAVAALALLAVAPRLAHAVIARTLRRWPALRARVGEAAERFADGLVGVRSGRHALPLVVTTVLCWALPAAGVWAVLRAVDLSLPWAAPWVVLAFLGLGVSLPSAPGFVGVFDAAAGFAVALFGVPAPDALAFALALHAAQLVPVTALGWALLMREHLAFRTMFAGATGAPPAAGGGGAPPAISEDAGDPPTPSPRGRGRPVTPRETPAGASRASRAALRWRRRTCGRAGRGRRGRRARGRRARRARGRARPSCPRA